MLTKDALSHLPRNSCFPAEITHIVCDADCSEIAVQSMRHRKLANNSATDYSASSQVERKRTHVGTMCTAVR
jgi:hypothetical protein